jgi:Spy/CpxP family protein refolding chaperone
VIDAHLLAVTRFLLPARLPLAQRVNLIPGDPHMNSLDTLRAALMAAAMVVLSPTAALADAPLKEALGLGMDQAKAANEIHRKLFPDYQKKRSEYNRQMRQLRRARIANDNAAVVREDAHARRLHAEMMALMHKEDHEIRGLLTPEQSRKFDAHLELRRTMVGSSRDDRAYTGL